MEEPGRPVAWSGSSSRDLRARHCSTIIFASLHHSPSIHRFSLITKSLHTHSTYSFSPLIISTNPFHFSAVYRRLLGHPPSHAGSGMPAAGTGLMRRQENP